MIIIIIIIYLFIILFNVALEKFVREINMGHHEGVNL
jgi:hypothetical protein